MNIWVCGKDSIPLDMFKPWEGPAGNKDTKYLSTIWFDEPGLALKLHSIRCTINNLILDLDK